ncbi:MAG TPA: hypothetical protein V6C46_10690 [Coleofasciculaceae cyanobacterium]
MLYTTTVSTDRIPKKKANDTLFRRSQTSEVLEKNAIAPTCQCDCAAHRLRQRGANLNDSPTHQSAATPGMTSFRRR